MESAEELAGRLNELTQTGARGQLLARGLARGMIWDDGALPPDSPQFSENLTNDLLNYGYSVLGCALRLRQIDSTARNLDDSFRTAAEAIEAAVRRGTGNEERGFHLTVSAAAFHLGHYAARSFSLMEEDREALNLSSVEQLLVALMQRRLEELERLCLNWLNNQANMDQGIADLLSDESNNFMPEDASRVIVGRVFHRAMATFDFALRTGQIRFVETAIGLIDDCIDASESMHHVPLWWSSILARHLIDDLWNRSLHNRLPDDPNGNDRWQELRKNFIDLVTQREVAEIDLWPSQLTAATRVIDESDSLVVALPTSSGKTRIAELCILKCLAGGRRVVYVTPLRALSAQVEMTLARTFQPLGFSVTSVYGASGLGASDVDTMASANIVVATPEKLDFAIRQAPEVIDDVGLIVLDEGHMIGLNEREIRYEVLVQRLLRRSDSTDRRIVCLSAIFTEGEPFDAFTQWIRADNEGEAIRSKWRPTRQRPATLEWQTEAARLEYRVQGETVFIPRFIEAEPAKGRRRKPFPKNRRELLLAAISRFHRDGHFVLVYCPERRSVESIAKSYLLAIGQGYASSLLTEDAKSEIQAALRIGLEWLGEDHVAMRALRVGLAVHHGQLPRPFLSELERLLRRKILSVAVSSPTLAQGVDLSFSVLLFNSLMRAGKPLPPKEFANVIGRVGRAFVDIDGIYVLPVRDDDKIPIVRRAKQNQRISAFHRLVHDSQTRQLESGLYQLISLCLRILQERLNFQGNELAEYVLNQQSAIDEIAIKEDDDAELLGVVLAELDAGIFALVENLDCDVADVANLLDEALKNSYWQRRLAVRNLHEQESQIALLHGRAGHVWKRTNPKQRSGFFAASIGTDAGLQIVEQADTFRQLLAQCSDAIERGDTQTLADSCTHFATLLFAIYPFQPNSWQTNWDDVTWETILKTWISGLSLTVVTDSSGIAFVQEALVYRLVWGIEATRIILSTTDDAEPPEESQTHVAICMTYGVPSIAAARMLEAGMESRLLAARLASELGLSFSSHEGLLEWLDGFREQEPIVFSDVERVIWQKFLARNKANYKTWHRQKKIVSYEVIEDCKTVAGESVRLVPGGDGSGIVFTSDFEKLGRVQSGLPSNKSLIGTVISDSEIEMQLFEPLTIPAWLEQILAGE